MSEIKTVYESMVELLEYGVIIADKRAFVVEEDGVTQVMNSRGTPQRKEDDARQATVYPTTYKRAENSNARVDLEFPDNDNARSYKSILDAAERTTLHSLHRPKLDGKGKFIMAPRSTEEQPLYDRGFYHHVLACPKPSFRNKEAIRDGTLGTPRDEMYAIICEQIEELPEYEHICKGEEMFEFLKKENVSNKILEDLKHELTSQIASGARPPADPRNMIFIQAASGHGAALWINPKGSGRYRTSDMKAELPEQVRVPTEKEAFSQE